MNLRSPAHNTDYDSPLDSFDVLGVRINVTNLELACRKIANWISINKKVYICCAPVSTVIDCQKDDSYRAVINQSSMTTPDGIPLVWLGKLNKKTQIDRTYGPDLMLALSESGQQSGLRHYFFGGSEQSVKELQKNLIQRYPGIKIAGSFIPSMRAVNERETQAVIDQINQAKADVLWIGLGSPKQDFWMHNHRDQLDVPVMIGVGAAFDFLSGLKKQAPRWMQRSGLEWLFRLCCEPRRLWKRYILGNFLFLFLLIKNCFSPGMFKK